MNKYFATAAGAYIGAFSGPVIEGEDGPEIQWPELPEGIEVPSAPSDARQLWQDDAWQPLSRTLVILDRLLQLDMVLPRLQEDLAVAAGIQLYGEALQARTEKLALRAELAGL